MLNNLKNFKKKTINIFFVILMVQIFLFSFSSNLSSNILKTNDNIKSNKVEFNTIFIEDTIRPQLRYELNSLKTSWVQYMEFNKNIELLTKQDNKIIYKNDQNQSLAFDPTSMIKINNPNNTYNIYNNNETLLLEQARPQWNKDQILNIFKIIASPIKNFGNDSGVIVYDSYTGQIILDTTIRNRGSINNYSIFNDANNPENKNSNDCKIVIENNLKIRKDTNDSNNITYLFNEPTNMGQDKNNFSKYPLGDYNRMFCEKLIFPYETIGVEGQPMQLTVVLSVSEKDIMNPYMKQKEQFNKDVMENRIDLSKVGAILIGVNLLSIIMILIAIYTINHIIKLNNK